jgi:CDP-L-myo-inositol myo-inositolphosphotransferase
MATATEELRGRSSTHLRDTTGKSPVDAPPLAVVLAAGEGGRMGKLTRTVPKPLIKVLGLTLIERAILCAKEAGICEFTVVIGYQGNMIKDHLNDGSGLGVAIDYIENDELEKENGVSVLKAKGLIDRRFVLLMADHIVDPRILKGLIANNSKASVVLAIDRKESLPRDTRVLEKEGKIIEVGKGLAASNCRDAGVFVCSPNIFHYIEEAVSGGKTELADGVCQAAWKGDAEIYDIAQIDPYIKSMRKEIEPFWLDVDEPGDIAKAKRLLIKNACKGRNDLLATYFNKPIENFLTLRLANTSISPNQVTVLTNIMAYTASFLFFMGHLALASALTFVVSFMDGVDGKLSRVKMAGSNLGKMEHAFDFLFEHSWYIALALYLSADHGASALLLCILIFLFDGLANHCGSSFGKVIRERPLHDYGPIERLFRKFDGRKNSYIIFILIGILLNAPFWSLVAVAAWSFVSAAFYASRTILHLSRAEQSSLDRSRTGRRD